MYAAHVHADRHGRFEDTHRLPLIRSIPAAQLRKKDAYYGTY
jgi:hypothetical protein